MRKLIFALVFGVLLIPDYGFTLGMGDIEVNSALNQQLDARIEILSAAPEDAGSLIVKLATREEFNRAGLDRPFTLNDLKFTPYVEDGQVYIKVSTPKPVREPFLNFLIEIDWPKGHLLREYTVLLDPPAFMGDQPESAQDRPALSEATTAAPAPVRSSAQADGFRPAVAPVAAPVPAPAPTAGRPAVVAAPVTRQQQSSYTPSGGYRVQQGDTAWSLANRMRPDESVSVEQMMLAMLRTNPEVFINENVNGLKRGYILRMPERNAIDAVGQAEALASIRQQNALWREYQQALAAGQPATAMGAEGTGKTHASGMPGRSDARLEIVSAGSGAATSGSSKDPSKMTAAELREQLALAREAVETERVEKEALQEQLGSLEQQVSKMKGLISIEDDSMAEMQAAGRTTDETTGLDEASAPAMEPGIDLTGEEAAMAALDKLTGEVATETDGDMAEPVEGEAVFIDEQTGDQVAEDTATAPDQLQPEQYMPEPEPQPQPDFITSLLNNPLVVAGLAAGVLVLLGLVYLLIKRRRDAAAKEIESMLAADSGFDLDSDLEDVADMVEEESIDRMVSDEEVEESMAEAEAEAEEEFDAEATMILPSADDTILTEAMPMQEEVEEERDDVIAEADVYLAYGIYQQAEDLLNNALLENPDKDAYRVKLAETYFAGKNAQGLSALGADMKQHSGGEDTAAWRKVVAMGKELCPNDEIFRQAGMAPDLNLDELMPKAPEPMDFDLGEDAGELDTPDLDFDFDSETETGTDEADMEMPSLEAPALDATAVMSAEEMPDLTAEEEVEEDDLADLEFDLSETEAVAEPADDKAEEEFSLDIEASELDIEDDASLEQPAPGVELTDEDEMEMEADAGELDFDIGSDEEDAAEVAVEDLSAESLEDVSLDELGAELDEMAHEADIVEEAELEMQTPTAAPEISDEDEMDLSDLGDVDEISTKLDLARAYIDMGDHEGAKDIIDEVLADGNDQQKQEAEELLRDMG